MSAALDKQEGTLPADSYRLLFPFVAGDLYAAPTTGDLLHPRIEPDGRFVLDLNRGHRALLASLEPTELSLPYLRIEPAAARLARLAPVILQADGIEPVGQAQWFDPDSRRTLLLLYLDRPAVISGRTLAGRPIRYDIRAASAGYVWVAKQLEGDTDVYRVTPLPERLVLAVTPLAGAR